MNLSPWTPSHHPSFTHPPRTLAIPVTYQYTVQRAYGSYTCTLRVLRCSTSTFPVQASLFPSSTCPIYLIRPGTFLSRFLFLVTLEGYSTSLPLSRSSYLTSLFSLFLAPPASQRASNWHPDPHPIFAPTPRLTDLATGAATPTLDLDLHLDLLDHFDLVLSLGLVMFI